MDDQPCFLVDDEVPTGNPLPHRINVSIEKVDKSQRNDFGIEVIVDEEIARHTHHANKPTSRKHFVSVARIANEAGLTMNPSKTKTCAGKED